MRRAALGLAVALAGCAAPPGPGEELRAEVTARLAAPLPEDPFLDSARREARRLPALAEAAAAGRAVALRCALGPDDILGFDAVLPAGLEAAPGSLLRIAWGDPARGAAHRVLGPVTQPALPGGLLAREGLPPGFDPARDYAPVRGWLLLRCRPGA